MLDDSDASLRIMHARVMELESELDETRNDLASATRSYRKAMAVVNACLTLTDNWPKNWGADDELGLVDALAPFREGGYAL